MAIFKKLTSAFLVAPLLVATSFANQPAAIAQLRVSRPDSDSAQGSLTKPNLQGEVGQSVQGESSNRNTLGFRSTPEGTDVWRQVADVDPNSEAYKQGLRAGDRIIDGSTNANSVKLAVERNGQTFELNIKQAQTLHSNFQLGATQSTFAGDAEQNARTQPLQATASDRNNPPLQGEASDKGKHPLQATVSVQDLQHLSERDVVVIIDRSGSMWARDCPYFTTRWQWCGEQATEMLHQTNGYVNDVTIVLFSTGYQIFRNCDIKKLPMVFMLNHPFGSTETAQALQSQIAEYFYRKQMTQGRCRPVVIAIITDGVPNDPILLKMVIVNATRFMQNPNEIAITFMQVGKDSFGSNLLHELDSGLVYEGAKFDIVDTKTFSQLKSEGLTKALVDAMNKTSGNQQPPIPYPPPSSGHSKKSKKSMFGSNNQTQNPNQMPSIGAPPPQLGAPPAGMPMPPMNNPAMPQPNPSQAGPGGMPPLAPPRNSN